MEKKVIYLGSFDKAVEFVYRVSNYAAALKLSSGSSRVNAASLLGVLSLNLSDPLVLEIYGEEASRKNLLSTIQPFLIEEW